MRLSAGQTHVMEWRRRLREGEADKAGYCAEMRSAGMEDWLCELLEGERMLAEHRLSEAEPRLWRAADLAPWNPAPFTDLLTLHWNLTSGMGGLELVLLDALYLLRLAEQEELWEDEHLDPVPWSRLRQVCGKEGIPPELEGMSAQSRAAFLGSTFYEMARSGLSTMTDARFRRQALVAAVFFPEIERDDVDQLLADKDSAAPMLGAILDGFAMNFPRGSPADAVENAMALLGAMGDAQYLGPTLAAISRFGENVPVAGVWAIQRWIQKDPARFSQQLRGLKPRVESTDMFPLVNALLGAGRGERFGPAWDAVFEAACLTGEVYGKWGPWLSLSALLLFGQNASSRVQQVRRICEECPQRESPPPMLEFQEPDASELEAMRARIRASRLDVYTLCAGYGRRHSSEEC